MILQNSVIVVKLYTMISVLKVTAK